MRMNLILAIFAFTQFIAAVQVSAQEDFSQSSPPGQTRPKPLVPAAPTIELYTVGIGETVMERFGHGSLCVKLNRKHAGDCFNYGTMDLKDPLKLSWGFVRGKSNFYVSVGSLPNTLAHYKRRDRSIWVQALDLSAAEATELARFLYNNAKEENRYYQYHHFFDNCTTRLRDSIHKITNGKLGDPRDMSELGTFRKVAREGLAGVWWMHAGTDLILGRGADRVMTKHEAMFLPKVLSSEVEEKLGVQPVQIYKRKGPQFKTESSQGRLILLGFGIFGFLVILVGWWHRQKHRKRAAFLGLFLGSFAGILIWGLAICSPLDMARYNEVLLVLWPFDIFLAFMKPAKARQYARLRLVWLALVLGVMLVGLLKQPLWAVAPWAGLPLLALAMPAYRGQNKDIVTMEA